MTVQAETHEDAWELAWRKGAVYMEDMETAAAGPNWSADFEIGGWMEFHLESRNLAALNQMIDMWGDEVQEFTVKRIERGEQKNAAV